MNTTRRMICTASLVLLLGTAAALPAARAQHPRTVARATVPFAFQYGTQTFAAGEYTFGLISDSIMAVRGPASSALGLVSWGDARPSEAGRIVFHRYGEQLVVQDIWMPHLSAHLHCPAPKQARHQEVAASRSGGTDVEVALVEGDH